MERGSHRLQLTQEDIHAEYHLRLFTARLISDFIKSVTAEQILAYTPKKIEQKNIQKKRTPTPLSTRSDTQLYALLPREQFYIQDGHLFVMYAFNGYYDTEYMKSLLQASYAWYEQSRQFASGVELPRPLQSFLDDETFQRRPKLILAEAIQTTTIVLSSLMVEPVEGYEKKEASKLAHDIVSSGVLNQIANSIPIGIIGPSMILGQRAFQNPIEVNKDRRLRLSEDYRSYIQEQKMIHDSEHNPEPGNRHLGCPAAKLSVPDVPYQDMLSSTTQLYHDRTRYTRFDGGTPISQLANTIVHTADLFAQKAKNSRRLFLRR